MNSLSFSELEQYQQDYSVHTAATQKFNHDEIERHRQVYASLVEAYHQVQLVDTEGCIRITLESLNHRATVSGSLVDIFSSVVEPMIVRLRNLECQILAMRANLDALNERDGADPSPMAEAILAACLPDIVLPSPAA